MAKKYLKNSNGELYRDGRTGLPLVVDVPDGNEVIWTQDSRNEFSFMISPFNTNTDIVKSIEATTEGMEVMFKYE